MKRWTWLHYDEAENHVLCTVCKNANDHGMLNNVKVQDLFIKTGHSNCKNIINVDKGSQKHKSSKYHQLFRDKCKSQKLHKMFPQC